MKIGILTFHRTANDGSVLQNWCLQHVLRSMAPQAEVETVDLRDSRREYTEFRRLMTRRPPFLQLRTLRKLIDLRRFMRNNITLSQASRTTGELNQARRFVASQGYDMVVSGSDTVWQLGTIGDAGSPHMFYQPGFANPRKVAFAVSADPIRDRSALVDPQRRDALLAAVADFDFIGVRDSGTIEMLADLGVPRRRLHFTPDPTILHDFSALVDMPPPRQDTKQMAGVALSSASLARAVTEILLARGWAVTNHLGPAPPGAQALPAGETIGRRLGRFADQDLLVTDRFHSSIFTLKTGKAPVLFAEIPSKWPEPISKGRDLLDRLGCGEFVWRPGNDLAAEMDELLEKVTAWRSAPPNMDERFQAVRVSGEPAMAQLAGLLA
jgi:polysaccharide pyruvyl transferase WcaK-like protein